MENDKLLKASDVKEYFKRVIFGADKKIDAWVDSIPTVDAVEVVRCRECMYSASIVDAITHERNGLWCGLWDLENVEEDFYCKDGQRREDGDT